MYIHITLINIFNNKSHGCLPLWDEVRNGIISILYYINSWAQLCKRNLCFLILRSHYHAGICEWHVGQVWASGKICKWVEKKDKETANCNIKHEVFNRDLLAKLKMRNYLLLSIGRSRQSYRETQYLILVFNSHNDDNRG